MIKVGVYADSFQGRVGQTIAYVQFIENFIGVPFFITPLNFEKMIKVIDVLLIPGGADVDPQRYNEIPLSPMGRVNPFYEYLDKNLVPKVIGKIPVIGICRGFQSINVMLGGSLHQHVIGHNQMDYSKNRAATQQVLTTDEGHYFINSIHHQAINVLGKNLTPIGYTRVFRGCPSLNSSNLLSKKVYQKKDDSYSLTTREVPVFVESFINEELKILGFQYHPEEFNCEFAISKIHNLL